MRIARRHSHVVLLLLAALVGCHEPGPSGDGPNVVLITIDTLRADRLGAYGSTTTRTPHIDRLAREGTLFENAMTPMPVTKPAHFSLLTSLYPRTHGVLNNELALPEDVTSVAEVFRDAGWSTAGFVASSLLDERAGATRGFDHFDAPRGAMRDAEHVLPRAMRWLEAETARTPFFIWIHLFDPHMPYAPPPELLPKAKTLEAEGIAKIDWELLAERAEPHQGDLPRAILERALELYDAEVDSVDYWIGVLIDALERTGTLDQSVVVFTADHGECFENGVFFLHSNCLYDAAVRVPLILRYPSAIPAERRVEVVEILDVAPTLLALADLSAPSAFVGRDLFAARSDSGRAFLEHPLYPTGTAKRWSERQEAVRSVAGEALRPLTVDVDEVALRTRDWKLVLTGESPTLYDLRADPGERRDVAGGHPEVLRELRGELEVWKTGNPPRIRRSEAINPELLEALRELGYLQ